MAIVHFHTRREALPTEDILNKLRNLVERLESIRDNDIVFRKLGRLNSNKLNQVRTIQDEWDGYCRHSSHLHGLPEMAELLTRYHAVSRLNQGSTRH